MATLIYNDRQMKEAKDKNALFSFLLPPYLSHLLLDLFKLQPPRVCEDDNMDVTLILAFSFSLLTLSLPRNQMVSPGRKEKEDINILAQTQGVQAMVPIRVNNQHHVTEQASSRRSHNPVSSDNQVPTGLPAFDKEKLLAMQARVLQGRLQSTTTSSNNMEMTKTEVPTGPVKRQVAEAWNNEKRKRNYEAPKPLIEEQHEISKTPGTCQCCEHYGRQCLQEDSLMTAEVRQRYHSDIKRKLSTQDPVLERVAQDEDRTQTINLDDWTISFKEFQPKRSKQSKKQIGKASQEKMELPQLLADRSVQPSSNQLQPEVVQPPYDNSIKKNPGAQAIPPRVEMQQKGNRDGRIKRVLCYKCGGKGHYANRCSTKR